MAQLAFGVGGAVAGSFVGQPQLGFAAGSLIGGLFNKQDDIVNEGPKISSLPTTTSAFGVTRSIVYGTIPVGGNIIDKSELRNIRHEEKQDSGGKGIGGGPDVTNVYYTAEIDLDVATGEGPVGGFVKVYANATLLIDTTPGSKVVSPPWLRYAIYLGDEDQLPDPTFEALRGAGNVPAYRGTPHIVFTNFQLEQFNNQLPSFRIIVASAVDDSASVVTKESGGGGNIAALLAAPQNSLAYHISLTTEKVGQVYDMYSQEVVFNLPRDATLTRIDEGGGAGLFSMPLIVSGVEVPAGPNRHLWLNVEVGDDYQLAIYDAINGQFLGFANLTNVGDWENFKGLTASERSGLLYRQGESFDGFSSYIRSWQIILGGGLTGAFQILENEPVLIPVPGREGANQWNWDLEISYPEGTDRDGTIACIGKDRVENRTYFYTIDTSNPSNVASSDEITSGFASDGSGNPSVVKIIWDSLNGWFWAIGVDETNSSHTRWRAYGKSGGVVHDILDTSGAYSDDVFRNGTFALDLSGILFTTLTGEEVRLFNTIDLENVLLLDGGFESSSGPYDMSIYHHGGGNIWKTRGGFRLDILRLSGLAAQNVLLSSVFDNFCLRAGLQPGQYLTSELDPKELEGYSVVQDGTFRAKMLALQQAYLVDAIDEGDLIRFRFRGQAPVATITEDELAVVSEQGSSERTDILIQREMELKLPGRTEVTYYNPATEYEQNTQMARREASFIEDNSTRIVIPVVLDDNTGIRLADTVEHLSHIEAEVYTIQTFIKYLYLTVGDVINIQPKGMNSFVGRIIHKTFLGTHVRFTCTREESSVLNSFLEGGAAEQRVVEVPNNPLTYAIPLDIPLLVESDNNAGYYMAGGGFSESWTGGNIYRSTNLQDWSLLGTLLNFSNAGTVEEALLDRSVFHWDRDSKLTVTMRPGGELSSVTEDDAVQGLLNTAVVGKAGAWEIVNFVNAVEIEPGKYELDTFIRGRIGTEWVTGIHGVGEVFVLLSREDLIYVADVASNLEELVTLRSVSFGQNLYTDQVIDQGFVNTGVCLYPLAPAYFEVERLSNLDLVFTWTPRTRFPLNNFWSAETSDEENYELLIARNSDGTVIHNPKDITTGSYTYTRVQQLLDGAPTDDILAVDCSVFHISQAYTVNQSRGYPSSLLTFLGDPPNEYLEYCASIGMYVLWELGEPAASTLILDTFGNYDGFTSGSPLREQPPLFAGYGNSTEFFDAARGKGGNIPFDEFDFLSFSVSCMVYPLEANTLGDQYFYTSYIDYGSSEADYVRIKWNADGTVNFEHVNTVGTVRTITWSSQLPIDETTHFVVTFGAPDPDTFGDFKAYVNGVLVGTVQAKLNTGVIGGDDALETSFGKAAETTNQDVNDFRMQVAMIFDRVVTDTEVGIMYGKTGL